MQDAEDFGFVGEALFNFFEGVEFHGFESGFDGRFVEGDAIGSLGGEFADGVVHEHEFVGGESAFVSRAEAGLASVAFVVAGADAGGADAAEEALGEDSQERAGDEVGFDADVEQAGDCTGGVVGVEGGEDEVACEGCLDGELCGFGIADFADEDDIGVLAEQRAETCGEGDIAFDIDLHLGDAVHVVFDGVFDGHDIAGGAVNATKGGVQGGGFT